MISAATSNAYTAASTAVAADLDNDSDAATAAVQSLATAGASSDIGSSEGILATG